MEAADRFLANFFTIENLSNVANATGVLAQASFIFFTKNSETLKIVSVLISALLLAGIVYCLKRGFREIKIRHDLTFKDILGIGPTFRPHSLRVWSIILKRLASREDGQFKLAVIEADRFFDHILKKIGYSRFKPEERFLKISASQFSDTKSILEAHKIANQLLNEPGAQITHDAAEKIINIYKKALEEIGLVESGG